MARKPPLMMPVLSLGAEHLVMGYLMRRNVLTFKAPPHNEGYDLICMHPDPRRAKKQLRIQVKSRYQTDSDRAVPIRRTAVDAFDYLVVVFLNVGYFYSDQHAPAGRDDPEFYTLPARFVWKHHKKVASGFDRLLTSRLDINYYKNERGFEQIADELGVPYPSREST